MLNVYSVRIAELYSLILMTNHVRHTQLPSKDPFCPQVISLSCILVKFVKINQ